MNNALCTADGLIYTALEFARLPADRLERLRRLLRCPECHGPGYFHNSSYDGRLPSFFGAWPHASGCSLAAARECETSRYSAPDIMDKTLYMPDGKIVVDFEYGAFVPPEFDENNEPELNPDGAVCNHRSGNRPQASFHRRLSTLLRLLVNSSEFRASSKPVEVHGYSEITVADFFVPLLDVTDRYLGCYRGYWGLLSDVMQKDGDTTVWFNSGGKDNVSFCMDSKFLSDFFKRYPVRDSEEFAGAYILVFGTLKYCPQKKFYCVIEDLCFMALRRG